MQKQNRDARFLYIFVASVTKRIFVIKWNLYVLELTYRRMSDANEADRSSRMAR